MDTTQLKNTYKIIQDKLRSCQNEKRNITTRKATKRTLLQESHYVLQNHLVNALTENVTKIKRISLDKDQGALIPIIPNSSSSGGGGIDIKDTLPAQQAHGFTIIKCRGWFINRRVWLQAQGHALNITQAHICCLPNKFIPETAHLNKCSSDGPQHLFLCFDLLPDVRVGDIQSELRAYCSYRQASQPFSSETCAIEWLEDLSWFDSLSISFSQQATLQAYFPCHVCVKLQDPHQFNQLKQLTKNSQPLDHQFSYMQDKFMLLQTNANLDGIELASSPRETTRDLIVSTSEYYVSPNYKTRAKVALITSQLFAT